MAVWTPEQPQEGRKFQSFTAAQGLSDTRTRALAEDRDGKLWIGTTGAGVMKVNRRGGREAVHREPAGGDRDRGQGRQRTVPRRPGGRRKSGSSDGATSSSGQGAAPAAGAVVGQPPAGFSRARRNAMRPRRAVTSGNCC
ncbi:MAG TPA: two-component regulator propeller domain-containing protein, partial [Verrucomicrobiae bacterium]|nr:two-component regulator propeller domain-containing protein [Verrucomicrobiae bacterium]